MDLITIDRIKLAHPILRATLLEQYKKANSLLGKNVRLRFSYVLRTFQEQNHLYALGRTEVNPDGKSKSKPLGNIVTNSKGGQSIHNYGLAFDIVLLIDKNNDGIFETATWDTLKDGVVSYELKYEIGFPSDWNKRDVQEWVVEEGPGEFPKAHIFNFSEDLVAGKRKRDELFVSEKELVNNLMRGLKILEITKK
jgi:hypothetical protein